MNLSKITFYFVIALTIVGCYGSRTEAMLTDNDPGIMVSISKADGEELLKGSVLKSGDYIMLENGNYLVKKTTIQKMKDYTIRTVLIPVTITLDSVEYVIGGIGQVVNGIIEKETIGQQVLLQHIGAVR